MTLPPFNWRIGLAWVRLLLIWTLLAVLLWAILLVLHESLQTRPVPSSVVSSGPAWQIPPLGVNLIADQTLSHPHRRAELRRLAASGIGWVRLRADWASLEPQRGNYVWSDFDALLNDVSAVGLVPVPVLDGSPSWARRPADAQNPLAPPADFADFAQFAGRFAAHYAEHLQFYQIWDEPNIAPHWGDRLIDPIGYAHLLKLTASAIRSVDADAVVLLAALAPTTDRGHMAIDEIYFLQRLYAAGAAPFFDVVAVQPFGFGTPAITDALRPKHLNFARVLLVRRAMLAAGDAHTPIWAVQFGWNRVANNTWRTVSPVHQILYTQQAVALAQHSWPWLATLAWAAYHPTAPPDDPLWGFALRLPDGTPHPLLAALTAPSPHVAFPAAPLPILLLCLMVGTIGVLLWRLRASWRVANGMLWLHWAATLPRGWLLVSWTIVLIVYYLATWPPLILFCWLWAMLLILVYPHHGILLIAAMLPFHFQHKDLDLGVLILSIPPAQAALICTLPALLRAPRLRWRGLPDALAVIWLLINLLSAQNVWYWPGYVHGLWDLALLPVLIYIAARLLLPTQAAGYKVVWALGLGGTLAAILGLIGWLAGEGVPVDGVRRLLGMTFSPNQSALYLLRSLFIMAGIAFSVWHGQRIIAWTGAIFIISALLLTGSRGALVLGLPAGLLCLGIGLRWRWLIGHVWWWGAAVLLMVTVAVFFGAERLANSRTVMQRLAIWQGTLALWQAYPLWGVGPGGFFWTYPAFMSASALDEPNLLHAHTVWLNLLASWGIAGMLWFLVGWKWFQYELHQLSLSLPPWRVGLLAAVVAGFAHAQVDAFIVLPELAGWFWLVVALLTVPTGSTHRQNENKNLMQFQYTANIDRV